MIHGIYSIGQWDEGCSTTVAAPEKVGGMLGMATGIDIRIYMNTLRSVRTHIHLQLVVTNDYAALV
jgi:hypothetical protein